MANIRKLILFVIAVLFFCTFFSSQTKLAPFKSREIKQSLISVFKIHSMRLLHYHNMLEPMYQFNEMKKVLMEYLWNCLLLLISLISLSLK